MNWGEGFWNQVAEILEAFIRKLIYIGPEDLRIAEEEAARRKAEREGK